ncbi:hypothetical protein AAVH_37629, partial [Aphelenchoides avenae]
DLLKESVFLKVEATQGETCCTGRLRDNDDNDDHEEVHDNRSHGSRRSRCRDDDGDDEDNLNYARND